jgi:uncharacterized protein (DUF2141 family)
MLVSCAMKVAPSGGPADTTPASVTQTEPTTGTRNFSGSTITVEFDDYVDRSIRNAISIQPSVRFTSSYAGNSIDIDFLEALQPNTTYAVSIGTDWRDLNGNSPLQPTSIIFSTGNDIDTGTIRGKIYGPPLASVIVALYPRADTLSADFSPARDLPAYKMAVSSFGNYQVGGLGAGRYRLVAFEDKNGNDLVDANERYAIAPHDIALEHGGTASLDLLLGPSYTQMQTDSVKHLGGAPDTNAKDTNVRDVVPGSIVGTFTDERGATGPYLARFVANDGGVVATVQVQDGAAWEVSEIAPGTYAVDIVIDANGNGTYDHGSATPFRFSELWYPLTTTVTVRQRWTTEGIRLVLK